jgi:hypothetical protein
MSGLDAKGRCCGRKPISYAARGDRAAYRFCTRCGKTYDTAGEPLAAQPRSGSAVIMAEVKKNRTFRPN